ncbi:hypothetical protein BU24DRAFT_326617, partial [Aaosphaeria arxii CBS 175.79]
TSCGNIGINYAKYDNIFYRPPGPGDTRNFRPAEYKTIRPRYNGTTTYIGYKALVAASIYGQPIEPVEDLVIDHTFYLCAPMTGNYVFSSISADDITEIWLGAKAYRGWTRPNVDIEQTYVVGTQTPVSTTVFLQKGQNFPVRVMGGNYQGAGEINVGIFAPDGRALLKTNALNPSASITSQFLLKYICGDRSSVFPPW